MGDSLFVFGFDGLAHVFGAADFLGPEKFPDNEYKPCMRV
jgi:hypothetical protein